MRILFFENGRWAARDEPDPAVARGLALGPVPVWVRAEGSDAPVWDRLAEWFDLHALALEDITNPRQRPKVEDYPGLTFVVMRLPHLDEQHEFAWTQVGLFVGEGFVLSATVHSGVGNHTVAELDEVERRLIGNAWGSEGGNGVEQVFYHIVDALVDAYFPFMDRIEDELDEVEDLVAERADRQQLRRIRDMKSLLSTLRKTVSPMREAAQSLERVEHPNITAPTRLYLRDVSDHMMRIHERLEHVREVTLNAQETWNSSLANQQNQEMKRLTVVAALLLVPSLLAGLGGMNFPGLPQWDYAIVTISILGLVAIGFAVAVWRKWL